jgi:hypothetical protein
LKIAVIGGGAGGFFAAIHASGPGIEVTILEKSPKVLSKVKISGGGRCNVTHQPMEISKLIKNYPRGEKFLKKAFRHFCIPDTIEWFESRDVKLKIESDGRVFPISDDSQSIIEALQNEVVKKRIKVSYSTGVEDIVAVGSGFKVRTTKGDFSFSKLIIATGGHPSLTSYGFLKSLNHKVIDPIPSLFTFNTPGETIRELMGVSVPDATVKLESTKLSYRGPILITHWGVSGPAVLKLSAFGAQWMHDQGYQAKAIINWNSSFGEQDYLDHLVAYSKAHPHRKIFSHPLFGMPNRLWEHFCEKSGLEGNLIFGKFSKKQINRLVQNLFCHILVVQGKTTFKEEFVTAGGIPLDEVDPDTMQSKFHQGLYFAGEVLNLDGITGGFNFQAAWTTGFIAGTSVKLTHL